MAYANSFGAEVILDADTCLRCGQDNCDCFLDACYECGRPSWEDICPKCKRENQRIEAVLDSLLN